MISRLNPYFHEKRAKLLEAYGSIHWLTFTKWFYEEYETDEDIWKDKRLWIHISIVLFCQSGVTMFMAIHLMYESNSFTLVASLTNELVIVLVAVRTYVLYDFPTFRKLYFHPEQFNCIRHRPNSTMTRLIKTVEHSRKVGLLSLLVFVVYDVSLLVLPIVPPIMEAIEGTNKTYDELIPQYPSINPISISWISKETKYALDLTLAAFNTIPWVGFVVTYFAVIQLLRAQHKNMMTAMTRGSPFPGDDQEPLDLKLWIQDHVLIRELVFEMRRIFSPALAGSIFVNVFTVGLNMLALISSPISPEAPVFAKYLYYISYGSYSLISISDIFIHCWLASEITTCGEELSSAIYENDWYTQLKSSHQNYVLPLMICNKKISFTALGMIPMTLGTFTDVLRVSYSYFTLLRETGG